MNNSLLFKNYQVDQTVFGEWDISESDGISYLHPKSTFNKDVLNNVSMEGGFIEDTLNLAEYVNKIPCSENVYIPTHSETQALPDMGHDCIKDECFYFYKDKKTKEYINTTLLKIVNEFGGIPLNTAYEDYEIFIKKIIVDILERRKREPALRGVPISPNTVIPTGLLVYTLHQLYCDFFTPQEGFSKSYDAIITTELTYGQEGWEVTAKVTNMYEALKLYLIDDKVNHHFTVKQCPHCQKIFVSTNQKQVRCSKECTNRANVKKDYYKRKGDNHAKTKE